MVGSTLARFAKDQLWTPFDFESNGVNPYGSLPWEIAWGEGTLATGLTKTTVRMIRWPGFTISPHLALKTHFDERRYKAEARDPREVWEEFSPILYSDKHRPTGHNILGFDSTMITTWRRLMGMPPDHSWTGGWDGRRTAVDADCIMKAVIKGWTIDISSPEAFLRHQLQCASYVEKGLKTNLGLMCERFGIPYDSKAAHSAVYDIARSMDLLTEMVKGIDI